MENTSFASTRADSAEDPDGYGDNLSPKKFWYASFADTVVQSFYRFLVIKAEYLIIATAILCFLSALCLRIHLVTAFIPEIGGVESNVIYSLQRVLAGYPLYTDPAAAPYSITQYTPLYYWLCWLVGTTVQVDPADVHQVYELSRGVSLLLNLLFAFSAFVISRNIFRIGKGLSFVVFTYAFVYLDEESFSRPDSLYNLLFLVTIGLFLKTLLPRYRPSSKYLIVASITAVLTIFSKQSGIYLVALLLVFTVFYLKNARWTLVASATMLVTFGGLFLLSSNGGLHTFLQNTVQGVNNGASVTWFAKRIMVEHFQKERFVNICGLFLGLYYLATGVSNTKKFLGLSLLVSFAFALITSFKIGAAPNYFTEFIVLTVIATAIFIASNGFVAKQTPLSINYRPLFLLVFVLFTLPPRLAGKVVKKVIDVENAGQYEYLSSQAVARFLYEDEALKPNEQVFVTTHVEDYLNKFLYRNAIFPQKEIVIANPPDAYNYSAFRRGLENGEVGYVIADVRKNHVDTLNRQARIRYNFLGNSFFQYVPIKEIEHYLIFKHKNLMRSQDDVHNDF